MAQSPSSFPALSEKAKKTQKPRSSMSWASVVTRNGKDALLMIHVCFLSDAWNRFWKILGFAPGLKNNGDLTFVCPPPPPHPCRCTQVWNLAHAAGADQFPPSDRDRKAVL